MLPVPARIVTAIQPLVRAGIHDFWPPGIMRQGAYHGIGMHPLVDPNALPGFATITAAHDPLANRTDEHGHLVHHIFSLESATALFFFTRGAPWVAQILPPPSQHPPSIHRTA